MRYQITHTTTYNYDSPTSVSHQLLRLTPRETVGQTFIEHSLVTEPTPALVASHQDYFGNAVTFLTVDEPHKRLNVTAKSVVEVVPRQPPDAGNTPAWEEIRELCSGHTYTTAHEACEFAFRSPLVPCRPEFADYAASSFQPGRSVLNAALQLMGRIHKDFRFDSKATTVATPLEQVLRQRRGVCQDFAHLQIACLRSMGLPARYVSGYLETLPPPGKLKLAGADASHAWLQIWCGESGWVSLDPTNNLIPADRHVTLAFGRDFNDVSPLRGVLTGSGRHQLQVAVDVVPVESVA